MWLSEYFTFFILFLFCNKPAKKNYCVRTLTAEPPPAPIRASTLLAGPPLAPPLSVSILWMTPQCNITDIYWIKLLTRLRLGLNHLREHKFRCNFQDTVNPPLCSCSLEIESVFHVFFRFQNLITPRSHFKH